MKSRLESTYFEYSICATLYFVYLQAWQLPGLLTEQILYFTRKDITVPQQACNYADCATSKRFLLVTYCETETAIETTSCSLDYFFPFYAQNCILLYNVLVQSMGSMQIYSNLLMHSNISCTLSIYKKNIIVDYFRK